MDCESIAQAVGAHVMDYAGLTVNQFCQSSSFAAVPHNLPSAVTINTKNQLLPISNDRTATSDVFLKQFQAVAVNGQRPLPAVQALFGFAVLYLLTAFRTEDVCSS